MPVRPKIRLQRAAELDQGWEVLTDGGQEHEHALHVLLVGVVAHHEG